MADWIGEVVIPLLGLIFCGLAWFVRSEINQKFALLKMRQDSDAEKIKTLQEEVTTLRTGQNNLERDIREELSSIKQFMSRMDGLLTRLTSVP